MNKKERDLTIKMLKILKESMIRANCNDFDFPESWSKEEVSKFVKDFHDYCGNPEEFDEDYLELSDWCVVLLLIKRLEDV